LGKINNTFCIISKIGFRAGLMILQGKNGWLGENLLEKT
jgi:hypothetical protein